MLDDIFQGAQSAKKLTLDAVLPQVYDELHRLAASYMRRERPGHTLQPTALVSETYLRLLSQHQVDFNNRTHLIAVAAQMMRRILRTYDEQRNANKRGGDQTTVHLSDLLEIHAKPVAMFGELDEALDRLAQLDERQGRIAELRIFGGLTTEETAEFMDVSVATAHRKWVSARLWLAREMELKPPASTL